MQDQVKSAKDQSDKTGLVEIKWLHIKFHRPIYGHITLKLDRDLGSGSAAAEMPVKFQSDWKSLNLAASRIHEILR